MLNILSNRPSVKTMSSNRLLLFVVVIAIVATAQQNGNESCGECDLSSCEPPNNCLAGMIRDRCNCCYECGRREGERCDHPNLRNQGFGRCGENLDCRMRTDLDPKDSPEAMCFCTRTDYLCGSDGVTYDNECQLTEARYTRRDGLRAIAREPCRVSPTIISSPEDIRNTTGSYVALMCEASGWPVPFIQWETTGENGETITLPGSDPHIAVQSRGGPGLYEVTSWLLFTRIVREDGGTYYCKAENDEGEVIASASIYVT